MGHWCVMLIFGYDLCLQFNDFILFVVMTPPGFLLICKLTIHLVKQAMMHIILDMQFYPLNRVQSLVQTINLTPLM